MNRLGHRPALDGIRGIAIIMVVGGHVIGEYRGGAYRGSLGVDLFFVLSGFLITALLLQEWNDDRRIDLRKFYGRRIRRLLPALGLVVWCFGVLTIGAAPERAGATIVEAVLRISYVANFLIAFTSSGVGVGFEHLWSLAQEEQFYLAWPLLLLVLLRRRARPFHLLAILAGAIVLVNVHRYTVITSGGERHRVWFAPDTHADSLLFGCAAAVIWFHRLLRPRVVSLGLGVLGVIAGAVLVDRLDPDTYIVALPIFAAGSALALITVLELPHSRIHRVFCTQPLRMSGKVSYSLYLWHAPLLTFFGVASVPFAVVASVLSYRYVEKPFLRSRYETRMTPTTVASAS